MPLPLKLFSLMPKEKVVPSVPTPAPAEISPVAFSSKYKSISVRFSSSLFDLILDVTEEKNLLTSIYLKIYYV